MHESQCKKLKQRNDTNKKKTTTNVSSNSNVGDETNKTNNESESKIVSEVIADLLKRRQTKTYTNKCKYQIILEGSTDGSLYEKYTESAHS